MPSDLRGILVRSHIPSCPQHLIKHHRDPIKEERSEAANDGLKPGNAMQMRRQMKEVKNKGEMDKEVRASLVAFFIATNLASLP